jgi:Xaa-Pro dipeptidase
MAALEEILKGKYPAKEHARRVGEWIIRNGGKKNGLIYLESQKLKYNEVSKPCSDPFYA